MNKTISIYINSPLQKKIVKKELCNCALMNSSFIYKIQIILNGIIFIKEVKLS